MSVDLGVSVSVFTTAERFVVLRLLNALSSGHTQAELAVLRADVLAVLGVTEADVAAALTGDNLAKHAGENTPPGASGDPDDQPDPVDPNAAGDPSKAKA